MRPLWTAAGVAGVIGAAGLVINSAREATVPAGMPAATGTMTGMAMPTDDGASKVSFVATDINGRRLSVPHGRRGVVLLVRTRGCKRCQTAARRLARARSLAGGGTDMTFVSVDRADTRAGLRRFGRTFGGAAVRYVLDGRKARIARSLAVSVPGTVVVYDRAGRVVSPHDLSVHHLTVALRYAGR